MPAVPCQINYNTPDGYDCPVDEPNVLVNSLTITPSREKKSYKNGLGCTSILQFRDPILTFAFDGYITTLAGLADQHPGTSVTSLANYQGATYGFDPADGVMVYEDPSRECSNEDIAKAKFNVVQYPSVEGPAVNVS